MNLYFRLLFTLLAGRLRSSTTTMGPCQTPFRCWFSDLDVLRHMNNGKYFSLMDLARVDHMTRSGLTKEFSRRGWFPVVVAETIRFHKSIKLFERFCIESEVIGWDEKAILMQQTFLKGGEVCSQAIVRARFLKTSGGSVTIDELLIATKITHSSPKLEPWVEQWNSQQSQTL